MADLAEEPDPQGRAQSSTAEMQHRPEVARKLEPRPEVARKLEPRPEVARQKQRCGVLVRHGVLVRCGVLVRHGVLVRLRSTLRVNKKLRPAVTPEVEPLSRAPWGERASAAERARLRSLAHPTFGRVLARQRGTKPSSKAKRCVPSGAKTLARQRGTKPSTAGGPGQRAWPKARTRALARTSPAATSIMCER